MRRKPSSSIPWGTIGLWYAASALSGVTSKQILEEMTCPFLLSACQFTIAYMCHSVVARRTRRSELNDPVETTNSYRVLVLSAWTFSLGMNCFNSGFSIMHVSINETLRALEPFVVVLLVACTFARDRRLSRNRLISMLPIALGVYLSAISNKAFSFPGLAVTMLANVFITLRAALIKRIESFIPADVIFSSTLYYAMQLQWLLAGVSIVHGGLHRRFDFNTKEILFAHVNGIFFYVHHRCSYIVLTTTDLLKHGIANAMRRVSTILFSVSYFAVPLHPTNACGMAIACVGAWFHSYALQHELHPSHTHPTNASNTTSDNKSSESSTKHSKSKNLVV
ncbi:hypothetical protein Ae201684P_000394 [Aphanomyces euteiches]|uniref:Sugar phosphate transporter domain-containing protein n=2 Tax=Aphanomyces euteiches TaxID=100861 RepID=A0A6G0XAI6_9STRA|nr:hypothetical protein Ae201684_006853 [Aphanomyces euteiches]KAH9086979.1 hypothetical protein Ae201684P_000394 [Aphanomyces euteiches]KAH9152648.1 hypothetical protein AeRB84_004948 [Aphanomyces euteiches]